MAEHFPVAVSAGSLRSTEGIVMPHAWTEEGVAVEAPFTGMHVLHLAVAGCVLNDIYREANRMGLRIEGVRVTADGDVDTTTWESTGIGYEVALDSTLPDDRVSELLHSVDEVAEVPRVLRSGTTVKRLGDG